MGLRMSWFVIGGYSWNSDNLVDTQTALNEFSDRGIYQAVMDGNRKEREDIYDLEQLYQFKMVHHLMLREAERREIICVENVPDLDEWGLNVQTT